MASVSNQLDMRAMNLTARLAAIFARPLDLIDPGVGQLAPLSAEQTRTIAANPAFRGPINRAVARELNLRDTAIDHESVKRLSESARARLAVLLISQNEVSVRQAGVLVGAAILHKRVLMLALKAPRERVRAVFGEDGFQVATAEAPMLHLSLAELDTGDANRQIIEGAEVDAAQEQLARFGLHVLCTFVERVEPGLSALIRYRWQFILDEDLRHRLAKLFKDLHCDHIVKLLRRRVPSWSAIIG